MDIERSLFFAQQVLTALFSVTNKLQMQGDKFLRDLTIRQILAIPAIVHAPDGKATINHIARQLGTTKQSAKQIVDAMEKKNYLSVAPSEQDRRAVNVTITLEGKQAFRVCSERTDEFLADIFHDFTTEDLEMLCTLLRKLYCFDGTEQDRFKEHMDFNPHDADAIMQHHQNFLKRKIYNHERKNQ
jgi:DNA-binding MarR family transcriptional regulator